MLFGIARRGHWGEFTKLEVVRVNAAPDWGEATKDPKANRTLVQRLLGTPSKTSGSRNLFNTSAVVEVLPRNHLHVGS